MNWKKTILIVLWGLFALLVGGAAFLVMTSPDRELPYVYVPEVDPESKIKANLALAPIQKDTPPPQAEETPKAQPPVTIDTSEKTAQRPPKKTPEGQSSQESEKQQPEKKPKENKDPIKKPEQKAKTPPVTQTQTKSPPKDTRPAWQIYASKAPYDRKKPRIAIIVSGLGLSQAATNAAIKQLPASVNLSFSPYTRQLKNWVSLSRSFDHETLIDLPLEPIDYPQNDPGPRTLISATDIQTNIENLNWITGRSDGIIGLTAFMGDRFVTSTSQMEALFTALRAKGLAFLDNGLTTRSLTSSLAPPHQVPYAVASSVIDNTQLSRVVIDSKLAQIERLAIKNGSVVALGRPYPVTLERLSNWANELAERGLQLVPLSAVLETP